jgi:hypothetical protein
MQLRQLRRFLRGRGRLAAFDFSSKVRSKDTRLSKSLFSQKVIVRIMPTQKYCTMYLSDIELSDVQCFPDVTGVTFCQNFDHETQRSALAALQ